MPLPELMAANIESALARLYAQKTLIHCPFCGHAGWLNSALSRALRCPLDLRFLFREEETHDPDCPGMPDVLVTMDAQRRGSGRCAGGGRPGPCCGWAQRPSCRRNTAAWPTRARRACWTCAGKGRDAGLGQHPPSRTRGLTRAVPPPRMPSCSRGCRTSYMLWSHLTREMIHISTQTAMAEPHALSGCTHDQRPPACFPMARALDDSICVLRNRDMRFHAARGSMASGPQQRAACHPDVVVEEEVGHLA